MSEFRTILIPDCIYQKMMMAAVENETTVDYMITCILADYIREYDEEVFLYDYR